MAPVPAVSELDMSKVIGFRFRVFSSIFLLPLSREALGEQELAFLLFFSSLALSHLDLLHYLQPPPSTITTTSSHHTTDGPRHHPRRRRRLPPLPAHQEARQARRAPRRQLPPDRHPGVQLHQLGRQQGLHADAVQLGVAEQAPGAGVQRQRGGVQVARVRGGAGGFAVGGVQGEFFF